jgi:hypothetical protein
VLNPFESNRMRYTCVRVVSQSSRFSLPSLLRMAEKKDAKAASAKPNPAATASTGSSSNSSAPAKDAKAAEAKRMPYYSADEVARHMVSSDCWVSFFGKVYDLTPLIAQHKGLSVPSARSCPARFQSTFFPVILLFPSPAPGLLVQPILKFAGQDISHWFDEKTKEVSLPSHSLL